MTLDLIAIDLAKRSFHLHGIDRDGVVLSRKIGRDKLFAAIGELARLVLPRRLFPVRTIGAALSGSWVSRAPDSCSAREPEALIAAG
jgi:hypothetical protein